MDGPARLPHTSHVPLDVDGCTVVDDLHRMDWTSPASPMARHQPLVQLAPPMVHVHPGGVWATVAVLVERSHEIAEAASEDGVDVPTRQAVVLARYRRARGAWRLTGTMWLSPGVTAWLAGVLPFAGRVFGQEAR